jgi:hypothetical protein
MSDDRPITAEQAALAAKAAGLDLDRPLNEQLAGDGKGGIEEQLATLTAPVESLTEALGGQGNADQPTEPQAHEVLAEQLHAAQSKWHTYGEVAGSDCAA